MAAIAVVEAAIRSIKQFNSTSNVDSESSHGSVRLGEEVSKLQCQFQLLREFLEDAEKRQEEGKIVAKWVSLIKDLAYEAQEITQKHKDLIKRHRRAQGNFFNNLLHEFLNPIDTADASRIYSLANKISRLTSKMKAYGIVLTPLDDVEHEDSLNLAAAAAEEEKEKDDSIVGVEEDVKEIENLLISPGIPKVIGICGTKGLGKTTLMREVLRRSMLVNEHFDSIFWAELGSEFEQGEVLRKMLLHLRGNDVKFAVADSTVCELVSKILMEKRCLLVLDDLQTEWNDSFRSALSSIFHPLAQSKVIIITCRASLLASVHHHAYLHQPKCLTNEQKWELFELNTDFAGQGIRGKILKSIGKSCLKGRFIGLPLSILVLGGIFTYDNSYILDAIYAKLARAPFSVGLRRKLPSAKTALFGEKVDEIGIQQVLELSYKALPRDRLRLCLKEMSNSYPEDGDNKISTGELYRVWIGERIVM